jgi:hypothetical protein
MSFIEDPRSVSAEHDGTSIVQTTHGEYNDSRKEDCDFIAHSRADLEWAVAEIERMRWLLNEAADRLDDADSHELVRRITYVLCEVE